MTAAILPFNRRLPSSVDAGQPKTMLNITMPVVLKSEPGRLMRVIIIAGSVEVFDCTSLERCGPTTLFYRSNPDRPPALPIELAWPCLSGLVIVPAAGSHIVAIYF